MDKHTHITWRKRNEDGSAATLVNIISDRERAADEVRELMLNPDVFAIRALNYPDAEAPGEVEATLTRTKIGPPTTA